MIVESGEWYFFVDDFFEGDDVGCLIGVVGNDLCCFEFLLVGGVDVEFGEYFV